MKTSFYRALFAGIVISLPALATLTLAATPVHAQAEQTIEAELDSTSSSGGVEPAKTDDRTSSLIQRLKTDELPEWTQQGTHYFKDGTSTDGEVKQGTHFLLVTIGPEEDVETLRSRIDEELLNTATRFLDSHLQEGATAHTGLDATTLRSTHLVVDNSITYQQPVDDGDGYMYQAQLSFGSHDLAQFETQWKKTKSRFRMLHAGGVVAAILVCLGLMMTYFRVDHATRGLHTGRLQFATGLAILAVVAVGAFVGGRIIPWF